MNKLPPFLFYFLLFAMANATEKPNFVFILADDCSYLDMEIYGGPAKTPAIKKLAKTGITFNRCYQSASMCSPTRHSLYTGLYPVKSGAHPNHARAYENVKSIPHFLSRHGYRVALAGKRHIEPQSVFPFEYIDEFADPIEENVPMVNGWRYPKIFNLIRNSSSAGKPFCLFLCSNEPHGPYTKGDSTVYKDVKLSPQQLELHRDSYAKYLAEITYFDGQVGEIISMLEGFDLNKNTLVMVASEQGSSYPFGKWTCYEMGVASGLIASWSGIIEPGTQTNAMVEYVDIVPTILDSAGIKVPAIMDGRSFLNVLNGKEKKHKEFAYSLQTTVGVNGVEQPYGIRSVVDERFRYILNLFPENEFSIPSSRRLREEVNGLGNKEKEFSKRYLQRPREELFDIIKDPYCQNNLAREREHKKILQLLAAKLDDWMVSQNDQGRTTELQAESRQCEWRQKQILLRDRKN
jgi:uncharacterized sulfatase